MKGEKLNIFFSPSLSERMKFRGRKLGQRKRKVQTKKQEREEKGSYLYLKQHHRFFHIF